MGIDLIDIVRYGNSYIIFPGAVFTDKDRYELEGIKGLVDRHDPVYPPLEN